MAEASLSSIPEEQKNDSPDKHFSSYEEDIFPKVIPCYYGKELNIPEDLVAVGFSALSLKHHEEHHSDDANFESENSLADIFKQRNSFWDIHRPELTKLNWPRHTMSQQQVLAFFHQHVKTHGPYCQSLHDNTTEEEPEEISHLLVIHEPEYESECDEDRQELDPNYCVQLTDEDIQPENQLRKSHGQFCVTIGILSSSFDTQKSELETIGEHSSTTCSEDVQSPIEPSKEGDSEEMYLQS